MLTTITTGNGTTLVSELHIAATFFSRSIGLLALRNIADEEGMLLVSSGSVHTFGMRFAIDVLFLDAEMRILKLVPSLKPWRVAIAPRGSRFVLELAPGRVKAHGLLAGMRLIRHYGTPQ